MAITSLQVEPEDLAIVRRILREQVPELEVRAIGSRVSGKARPFSDLNLVLMTDKPLSLLKAAYLSMAFTESDLPYLVDVVDWAGTSESFRRVIDAKYVVVEPARPTQPAA